MPLLNDKIQTEVRKALQNMAGPVKLVMFTQVSNALECQMCSETRALVEEIAALSPAGRLSVEVHDFLDDQAAAEQYKVDKIPAIAVVGARTMASSVRLRVQQPDATLYSLRVIGVRHTAPSPKATRSTSGGRHPT
jgi:hypothetical protein